MSSHRATRAPRRARGFSLVELMLAVMILGLGVIAVAALFPAGIAQQRQSADDILGPVVANNALAVLRVRLRPEDFGTFEEFGVTAPQVLNWPNRNPGDWPWLRPAFYANGAIDVFNGTGNAAVFEDTDLPDDGIPYNTFLHGSTAPFAFIGQVERYYPMRSSRTGVQYPGQPQYVWDCMFRRFQGQIQVAIFVYRISLPAGGNIAYRVPPNPSSPNVPPLPISRALQDPWDADADLATQQIEPFLVIPGTGSGSQYDPSDHAQQWQAPAQWLLDQNNNVHRVLAGRRRASDGPVELVRPIPALPPVAPYILDQNVSSPGVENVVGNIWYIPTEIEIDSDFDGMPDLPVSLAPVYVTVREL